MWSGLFWNTPISFKKVRRDHLIFKSPRGPVAMSYFYSFFWGEELYGFCTHFEFNQYLSVLIIAASTHLVPVCGWRGG
jgi:hypothetical protein